MSWISLTGVRWRIARCGIVSVSYFLSTVDTWISFKTFPRALVYHSAIFTPFTIRRTRPLPKYELKLARVSRWVMRAPLSGSIIAQWRTYLLAPFRWMTPNDRSNGEFIKFDRVLRFQFTTRPWSTGSPCSRRLGTVPLIRTASTSVSLRAGGGATPARVLWAAPAGWN